MTPQTRVPVSATAGFARDRRGTSPLNRRVLAAVLALVAVATAGTAAIDTGGDGGASTAQRQALSDANSFLDRYVKPSGQVVRRDQGNTTVSEGQAYALLLSEATGRDGSFRRVWRWTAAHLRRPNGELAYLASSTGQPLSSTPAADADVLAAWALSRYRGPGAGGYHAQARRMSAAILDNETVRRGSELLLAAGPWATGSPASLDPSYWSAVAFTDLARFTGDQRWTALAHSTLGVTRSLTGSGRLLPPDWARLDGSHASPTPAPSGNVPQVQFGLDAQRLVIWMAADCAPADRRMAASWWHVLSTSRGGETALATSQSGAVLQGQANALPPVAAAAAAGAAGDNPARARLLRTARGLQAVHPTYYGGAWLALGEILLGTGRLGGCGTEGGI